MNKIADSPDEPESIRSCSSTAGCQTILLRVRRNVLHDLAVVGWVVAAHAIAIDEVDVGIFTGSDQQIRCGAGGLRGQKDGAGGTEIQIVGGHVGLIERREGIRDGESAGAESYPQDAVAEIVGAE